jgi:hypothetical protein
VSWTICILCHASVVPADDTERAAGQVKLERGCLPSLPGQRIRLGGNYHRGWQRRSRAPTGTGHQSGILFLGKSGISEALESLAQLRRSTHQGGRVARLFVHQFDAVAADRDRISPEGDPGAKHDLGSGTMEAPG